MEHFTQWRALGRMEEVTCKEIRDNKHYDDPRRLSFAYHVDGVATPVGKVDALHFNTRNRSCEIGYLIDPAHRGRGYGKAMLREALRVLFGEYGLNKVHCQTASFNTGSVHLLESLGFHRDGTLREHHELDGVLYDDFVYSLVRREFEKLFQTKKKSSDSLSKCID